MRLIKAASIFDETMEAPRDVDVFNEENYVFKF